MLPICHFNAVLVTLYHAVEIQKGCGGFGGIRYRVACVGIAVVATSVAIFSELCI